MCLLAPAAWPCASDSRRAASQRLVPAAPCMLKLLVVAAGRSKRVNVLFWSSGTLHRHDKHLLALTWYPWRPRQERLEEESDVDSVTKVSEACRKELLDFNKAIAKNPNANVNLGASRAPLPHPIGQPATLTASEHRGPASSQCMVPRKSPQLPSTSRMCRFMALCYDAGCPCALCPRLCVNAEKLRPRTNLAVNVVRDSDVRIHGVAQRCTPADAVLSVCVAARACRASIKKLCRAEQPGRIISCLRCGL